MLTNNKIKTLTMAAIAVGFSATVTAQEAIRDFPEGWHTEEGCGAGKDEGAYVLVTVRDIRLNEGLVRVQTYDDNPDNYLEKGKRLMRMVVPTNYDEEKGQDVCVHLPGEGKWVIYVLHDQNGNMKTDFFTDGFGFSRNPKMGLSKPAHKKVLFKAKNGLQKMDININYVIGADEETKKRRRRSNRR